jgi:hypothetical protein
LCENPEGTEVQPPSSSKFLRPVFEPVYVLKYQWYLAQTKYLRSMHGTFYNVPRKYARFSEGVASRSTATSKVVKVRKTNVEHGTWYCSQNNSLWAAGDTNFRTSMKIEHYPQPKLVRVYLRLHPGYNLSEVRLPKPNDNGSFPLDELLG